MSKPMTSVISQELEEVVASNTWDSHPDPEKKPTILKDLFPANVDEVNSPPHYNHGSIECIDYLKDNLSEEAFIGYLEGNTKKYLHRWRYKGKGSQDLAKAQWYLNRLQIEVSKKEIKNG